MPRQIYRLLVLALLIAGVVGAAWQRPVVARPAAAITVDLNGAATPFSPLLLGSNLPAWLGPTRVQDSTFIARTRAAGLSLVRIPGGSWSNSYDWSACEQNNVCPWDWGVLKPTHFIDFLQATGAEGMFTVNPNATTKEAAALVAFFNGSVSDNRVIGVDIRGHDWGRVSDWAQLRRDHGNPDPVGLTYWEIGNEVYGGKPTLGTDCLDWGWEEVWTCDGTEYVQGIGSGATRHEGYTEFRTAMRAIDPTIKVGAVGTTFGNSPDWWVNFHDWGNEVIAAAGATMDFYIVHHYAYFEPPASREVALTELQTTWPALRADLDQSFAAHANNRAIPVAVTEYNLFSVGEQDNGQWMKQGVNLLFIADSIGQMAAQQMAMAAQWDIANGEASNGTDYGLLSDDTFERHPQYYAFPLWSRFGTTMLPATSTFDPATTLSVYAGRRDAQTVTLLAVNKTNAPISTTIGLDGAPATLLSGTADVARTPSLDSPNVTFNGVATPSDDLSDAPPTTLTTLTNPLPYTFQPYSVTLLRLTVASDAGHYRFYLPMIIK